MKLTSLLDLIGLTDKNRKEVDDEIDKIIRENNFTNDKRYKKLYEILGVDKLNKPTQREIAEKLDEVITKERFRDLDKKHIKNLYEMYYPKKFKKVNEVEKISKDDFKWVGSHSKRLEEMSLTTMDSFYNSPKKVWIDENNVVLFSNTHLTSNGDRLTETQKEYLNQMGISFILHKTGD